MKDALPYTKYTRDADKLTPPDPRCARAHRDMRSHP